MARKYIPLKPILVALLILVASPTYAIAPKPYESYPYIVMGNTLKAKGEIGSRLRLLTKTDFEGLEFESLISCLAWYESSWRTDVYGDGGRAYGPLQYHEPTFEAYCEGDYKDPFDQIDCADRMLQEDFGNISHWTTASFCLD